MSRRGGVRVLLAAVCVVVIVAVGAGLWILGSPAYQRAQQADRLRVKNLVLLTRQVDVYSSRYKKLPEDLHAIDIRPDDLHDPVTGSAYEYTVTGAHTYELCATFQAASPAMGEEQGLAWTHGEGHQCFKRDAQWATSLIFPGLRQGA